MKLLPTTIEGWNAKKTQFMRLLKKEQPWTHMAFVYENAVNYCDRKIRQVHKAILILLACLILAIGGCAKIMRGSGLIVEGLGDGVVAGGQHLQESTSK